MRGRRRSSARHVDKHGRLGSILLLGMRADIYGAGDAAEQPSHHLRSSKDRCVSLLPLNEQYWKSYHTEFWGDIKVNGVPKHTLVLDAVSSFLATAWHIRNNSHLLFPSSRLGGLLNPLVLPPTVSMSLHRTT